MPKETFVHLHTHSHYSLLDGLAKIDDLVKEAARYEMPALALTDHGNLYGAVEFYKKAVAYGIKPIIGVEAYVAAGSRFSKKPGFDEKRCHLTLLAENNLGYHNLLKLVSASHLEGFYYKPRVDKELLSRFAKGLIATSGCISGEISRSLISRDEKKAAQLIDEYKNIFGKDNFFIELSHHPGIPNHADIQKALQALAKKTNTPVIAAQDIHYIAKEDAKTQDVLLAIQTNTRLDDQDRLTMKNDDFSMRSPLEMSSLFSALPEAVANTIEIANRVNFKLELGKLSFPGFDVPDGETRDSFLEKLCRKGLSGRYGQNPPAEALKRLEYELSVIKKTGFVSYFLIVQDIVNWAKQNGILVGPGRGSAAGSLVAYLTNITNIDPLKYGLLFERFMNPERVSPPDIDLDFADTRRNEVLEYVTRKFGENHVAQIITFGTMAARAAVRDAGRALGVSYDFCDRIAKMIPFGKSLSESFDANPDFKKTYESEAEAKKIIDTAVKLEGVSRHASVHACGVVITADPLIESVPLQYASRSQSSGQNEKTIVTQYEMRSIEDLGLLKMDILGLKNLSIIENTVNLVKDRSGRNIDIDAIELNDDEVFKMLAEGKTAGIFQLEGDGMTRYLVELKPTNLEDIAAMISLFRPGPIELIPSYIARKHGREKITCLNPKMEPILENTHGIMIYQEQLMRVAQDIAGFNLSEADILRKAVGKKIKSLLEEQKEKFISGVEKNMGERRLGEKIWEQIEPFARYGFNKSHASGYALIAYQTAWLKCRHALEFMTSLMNADEKDTERIAFLVEEAKKLGIKILPPDINLSEERFTPANAFSRGGEISGQTVRFGLATIKNVGSDVVSAIIEERKINGPYSGLADLLERVSSKNLNKKSLEALVKSGALDSIGERNQTLANMDAILEYRKDSLKSRIQNQSSLFGLMDRSSIPSLKLRHSEPATFDEKIKWEKELLGLYVSGHPLDRLKTRLETEKMNINAAKSLADGAPAIVAGYVESIKKILTKNGEPMAFLKMIDFSGSLEALVFPRTLNRFGHIIREETGLKINGRISRRNDSVSIIANNIKTL